VLRTLLIGVVLLAPTSGALCAALPSVYLEDLTWVEVQAALRSGQTTIIIPVGGTEQNGPHMALGKHNVRARVLAGKIAARELPFSTGAPFSTGPGIPPPGNTPAPASPGDGESVRGA
jgi:hypothetical protein